MTAELREFIVEHFSRDELMTFCADYVRDFYEDYEGSAISKTALARDLIEHCMRRGEMPMLQAGLQNARPEPYAARFGRIVVAEVKAKPRNPRQVFLSYSTQDLGFAQRLADDLRAKGLPVWAAFDSIRPGESWTSAINRGLSESGIYVVVLSKHSVRSTWVKTETGIALTEHKRGTTLVIPLLVQECDVKQLSPLLTTIQLVDFRNDFAVSLANLLAVLDVWRGKEIVVQVDRLKLRDLLLTHAISDDLRVICFDLGVNYEEVIPPSAVLTTAVINLITFFSTRGSLVKLAARVKRQFPDGQWNEVFVQAGESHKPSTTTPIEPHESDISSSASRRSNGPLRVFLCHASEDKPRMRELYVILKRDGIQPWLDEEDLLLGRNWRNQILRAIQSSDVILVCLSNSSISKNGYVKQEIELALDLADRQSDSDGRLIPVRLEECPYPERVGDFQGVDLFHPIGVQG